MEPEVQLRKAAILLTVVLLLQLLWSGARLMLLSEPEMKVPAEASLNVDGVLFGSSGEEIQPDDLVTRPVFWSGRQVHVESGDTEATTVVERPRGSSAIDNVELMGIYAGGGNAGIIVSYKGERRRLKKKDSIEDWTFTMYSADSAVFESGGERRVLNLEHAMPKLGPKTRSTPKSTSKASQNPKADVKSKERSKND